MGEIWKSIILSRPAVGLGTLGTIEVSFHIKDSMEDSREGIDTIQISEDGNNFAFFSYKNEKDIWNIKDLRGVNYSVYFFCRTAN